MGAFGQDRTPREDARVRRNSQAWQDDGGQFIVDAAGGLQVQPDGTIAVYIVEPSGLQISANGLKLHLATDPGLEFSGNTIQVKVANPIKRDSNGVGLNIGAGLELSGANLRSTSRLVQVNTADANSVANTVAETNYTTNYVIPANFLIVGRVIRITCSGRISDTGAPTVTFRLKLGTTVVQTHSLALTGATDAHFEFKFDMVLTVAGATGTIVAHDIWSVIAGKLVDLPKASASIDTTAANTLQLSCEWSAADPGNSATLELFMVETLDE